MARGVEFGVGHALAAKRWSKDLERVAPKDSKLMSMGLVGTSKDHPIQVKTDLKANAGTEITFGLREPLRGVTTIADDILEGKERSLDFNDFTIRIGQERIAEKTGGELDGTRVSYDVREEMRDSQSQFWGEHYDEVGIIKLSGDIGENNWNTVDSRTIAWDRNTLSAPTSDRWIVGTTLGAAITTLTSSMKFTLDVIDECELAAGRQSATTARRKIRKTRAGGEEGYIMIIDKLQFKQLVQSTDKRFYDLYKAEVQGKGGLADSPLFGKAKFKYSDTYVFVFEELVRFSDYGGGGNLKAVRALFMGAQAGMLALGPGEKGSATGYYWRERKIDYGNKLGVATGKIWGFQKTSYSTTPGGGTDEDYGVIAVDTYVESF